MVNVWWFRLLSNCLTAPYTNPLLVYDDMTKWKHFAHYWPFVRASTGRRRILPTMPSNADFDDFFVCNLSKHFSKQSSGRWMTSHERHGVSNLRLVECMFTRFFLTANKKTSKLLVTDPFWGESPVTGGLSPEKVSNVESVPITWRHNVRRIDAHVTALQW